MQSSSLNGRIHLNQVLVVTSKNEGKTWSDTPSVIMREKGAFVRNTPIRSVETPGEWILPMYYTPDGLSATMTQYAAVKFSKDPSGNWSEVTSRQPNALQQKQYPLSSQMPSIAAPSVCISNSATSNMRMYFQ